MSAITIETRSQIEPPSVHVLAHGVTVVAQQVPIDAVNLTVWLDVGSAIETDAINGMAHFLEHMIFKGTQRQRVGEFEAAIEARGGRTNASTSQDYTNYYITVAPENFTDLAPLLLDLVLNAEIPDAEFMRERDVVLEEIRRSEDNVNRRIHRYTREMVYEKLPYRRAVLGPAEVVADLSADQMRQFHRFWYTPEHMTIVVVGNLSVSQMLETVVQAIGDRFASDRNPHNSTEIGLNRNNANAMQPKQKTWQAELPFNSIVRQEVIDPKLQQARLLLNWRVPGLQQLEQTYALYVLAEILGSGRTSRLVKDLREHKKLVNRISAGKSAQQWQGTFRVVAHLAAENLAIVEQEIRTHIARLHDELVSPVELAKIRTRVANRFVFSNESPKQRSGMYGFYHRVVGQLDLASSYPQIIGTITAQQLQQAAQTYLNPDACGILTVVP
ncbi:processing peptidase [Thalassoporum mexicanum PCC 7367]|uniref:M16 family metallopeptidase n=1 Tax=Thalassoporum mexicanum TaxID=3457544 RepID=UPI00029FBED1|nr:pitrilysin family protein [Pseudanabaena sp. PCC 7367]AFY70111.1 processing peptidase [Pseudanabaena sp. PCC 7367]